MPFERALVVDDDSLNAEFLRTVLQRHDCEVAVAHSGEEAWEIFDKDGADMLFTDLRMPGMGGIELLGKVHAAEPRTSIVVMTAYASLETAIEAMRRGAYDYLIKPFQPEQVAGLLSRIRERHALYSQNEYLQNEAERADDEIVTGDPGYMRLLDEVKRAAATKVSVLVHGESGTGKELIARAVHRHSPRAGGAFIRVNCAALSETLLESELFGHEKGAFTGATAKREGRFELADGGTLLLDEISEISPSLQAKLLRVLEEEEFERVGGTQTLRVNVRIVATTNRDLRQAMAEGQFREDLYYRLNVVPVQLPPLRERRGDIPLLIDYFLDKFCRECGRDRPNLSDSAIDQLLIYPWPGNVRELRNLMHRLVALSGQAAIEAEDLPAEFTGGPQDPGDGVCVGATIDQAERWLILNTLDHTSGHRNRAADILGVTTRTLRNKLSQYRRDGIPA